MWHGIVTNIHSFYCIIYISNSDAMEMKRYFTSVPYTLEVLSAARNNYQHKIMSIKDRSILKIYT